MESSHKSGPAPAAYRPHRPGGRGGVRHPARRAGAAGQRQRGRTVRLWDAATGHPVGDPLTGHTGAVSAVAFGPPDGRPAGQRQRRRHGAAVGPRHRPTRSATRSPATPARCPRWRSAPTGDRCWPPAAATARCGCGTRHRPPDRRPAHRPHRRGGGGGVQPARRAPCWPPPATTARCGCGTPTPANPVGEPLTGHTGAVSGVAFEPRRARGWPAAGARRHGAAVGPRHRPPGRRAAHRPHRLGVRGGVRSSRRAALLASASDDDTVRLWDPANPTAGPLHTYRNDAVHACTRSASTGPTIYIGCIDGIIALDITNDIPATRGNEGALHHDRTETQRRQTEVPRMRWSWCRGSWVANLSTARARVVWGLKP